MIYFFKVKKIIAIIAFVFLIFPAVTLATDGTPPQTLGTSITQQLGTVGGAAYGGAPKPIQNIIADIINAVLGLLGIVMVGLMIYGGYLYMTASGNEEQVKKAKGIIINTIIGLVIVLLAFAISSFVIGKIIEATQTSF